MKILILGGNGFIGSNLVDKLLLEGHYVRVFDQNKEYYRNPLPEVDYHYGNLGNRELLSLALINIDIVVHLISTTLPKTSNDNPIFDIADCAEGGKGDNARVVQVLTRSVNSNTRFLDTIQRVEDIAHRRLAAEFRLEALLCESFGASDCLHLCDCLRLRFNCRAELA